MTPASPRAPRPTVAGSRRQFFRRTRTHLAGAIAVFALIESLGPTNTSQPLRPSSRTRRRCSAGQSEDGEGGTGVARQSG